MRRALILVLLVALALGRAARRAPDRTGERDPRARDEFRCSAPGSGTAWGSRSGARTAWRRQGWGPSKILKHFYSGTRVARRGLAAEEPADRARAGRGLDPARGAGRAGRDPARATRRPATTVATIPAGETWNVRAAGNEYRIVDATGDHRRPRRRAERADLHRLRVDRTRAFASPRRATRTTAGRSSSTCTRAPAAVRRCDWSSRSTPRATSTASARCRARGRCRPSRPRRSRRGRTRSRRPPPRSTGRCATARCTRARTTRCTPGGTRRAASTATGGSPP